jgi:transposase
MTSHHYTETATPDATKRYPSDLNDWEFDLIAPQVAQKVGSGKKRTVDIREVLNAIFYRTRTGCQWRMLPSDFLAWYHVWYYYRTWRDDGTWEHINMLSAAMCAPRPVEILNQVLGLLTVRAWQRLQWAGRRDLIRTSR